jgi:hypothetical protein
LVLKEHAAKLETWAFLLSVLGEATVLGEVIKVTSPCQIERRSLLSAILSVLPLRKEKE